MNTAATTTLHTPPPKKKIEACRWEGWGICGARVRCERKESIKTDCNTSAKKRKTKKLFLVKFELGNERKSFLKLRIFKRLVD